MRGLAIALLIKVSQLARRRLIPVLVAAVIGFSMLVHECERKKAEQAKDRGDKGKGAETKARERS